MRGIEIGFNWSLLVVFALITWTLTAGVFPRQNEGLSDGTYLAMGIAAAVLFFLSVLLLPGLALQRLTTREPDLEETRLALVATAAVLRRELDSA